MYVFVSGVLLRTCVVVAGSAQIRPMFCIRAVAVWSWRLAVVVMCLPIWPYVVGGWLGFVCFALFAAVGPLGVSLDPMFLPNASASVVSPSVS